MLQPAVSSRSPSPVPVAPGEGMYHVHTVSSVPTYAFTLVTTPIDGIFKEMLVLCNTGLKEATAVESERAAMKSNHLTSIAILKSWQDQASQNQEDLQQMRKRLAEKDAELQHTRKLLTDKWTSDVKAYIGLGT